MTNNNPIDGWQEALFCVTNLDRWIEFWQSSADWALLHRGPVDPLWLTAWGLDTGATAEEALIGQPGQSSGQIRLVKINDVIQRQMRSGGQAWETGGWFDINVRVRDIAHTQNAVHQSGWTALSDPVEMTMGPVQVKEWIARGPDGIAVAFIERVEPPLSGFPDFARVSRAFNATQIVADEAVSRAWYEQLFGFEVFIDTPGPGNNGGPNVFGLPHNLIQNIPSHLLLLHPRGESIGSIEFCGFNTITGRDFSTTTRMPNLGIASLRFPVTNVLQLAERLHKKSNELQWIAQPSKRPFKPYGDRECFILKGPNGEWVEFFEA